MLHTCKDEYNSKPVVDILFNWVQHTNMYVISVSNDFFYMHECAKMSENFVSAGNEDCIQFFTKLWSIKKKNAAFVFETF